MVLIKHVFSKSGFSSKQDSVHACMRVSVRAYVRACMRVLGMCIHVCIRNSMRKVITHLIVAIA